MSKCQDVRCVSSSTVIGCSMLPGLDFSLMKLIIVVNTNVGV